MDRRYQVFVSSTFYDLERERQEVIQALLELDCIPAGMEIFPAADDDQWTLIKRVIDDCDYYIVIVAGRYGTLGPDGSSYTEAEYRYALSRDIPIIGFVHKNPGQLPANLCETNEDLQKKLAAFKDLVIRKSYRQWEDAKDLGSQVSRSLIKLIRSNPASGWIRADSVPALDATEEILTLRRRIDELEAALDKHRLSPPEGSDAFAQGNDHVELSISFDVYDPRYEELEYTTRVTIRATWDEIFVALAPYLLDEEREGRIKEVLDSFSEGRARAALETEEGAGDHHYRSFVIDDQDFQRVKVQLRALGLITLSEKTRRSGSLKTHWTLTPLGDAHMTRLMAIKRA